MLVAILNLRRLYCQGAGPQRIDHGTLVAKERLARPDLARPKGFEPRPWLELSAGTPENRFFSETGLNLRYLCAEMIAFRSSPDPNELHL